MKQILKNKTVLLVLFGLGIALAASIRLHFALYFAVDPSERFIHDQEVYHLLAVNMLHGHGYSTVVGQPYAYVPPFYAMFLTVVYWLFSHCHLLAKIPIYFWARIAQFVLGTFTCFTIYLIAKEVFGRAVAFTALFLMGIHYIFLSYGTLLMSENLFVLLVALSMLSLIKFCKSPSYAYAVLFGTSSALATLTRSAYLLFPFMVFFFFLIKPGFLNITRARITGFFTITILCIVIPVGLWTIRNYKVFKDFIPLGTETGIVIYSAYNPPKGKVFDAHATGEVMDRYNKMPETEGSRFLTRQALCSIKKEPSKFYRYIPLKLMYFFSPFDWVIKGQGEYNFSTAFVLPLAFMGIFVMTRKRFPYMNLLLLSPLIYFILITIAIMGVPRTRMPVEPYLVIYAAFFLNYIYGKASHKVWVIAGAFFWYLVNYIFYLNSIYIKEKASVIFQKMGLW